MSSPEEIAAAFVSHYYTTFTGNRPNLASLYTAQSTLTFEGQQMQGPELIVQKMTGLGNVQFDVAKLTKDVQLGATPSTMLIFITGQLIIDQNPPMQFSQVFQLVAAGTGSSQLYIHNEIFRLCLT